MKIDTLISGYIKSQKICDPQILTDMIVKTNEDKSDIVIIILELMNIGSGWGKFAFSVLSQGIFSEKQVQTIHTMKFKTSLQEALKNTRQSRAFDGGAYEELDMVGWNGHGF
jgi:hypothetical protein